MEEKRTKKMLPIGSALTGLLANYNLLGKVRENQAINIWKEVVGAQIAKVTVPDRVENGILYVKVKHDVWRNEVIYQKRTIVENLNQELNANIIRDIKFN
ncbi:DUF721 domain-containing protein [candidate division KSB1 bacterium]|nr:DUF721 domain-containing protein [candidate division KSB1 bacterium]